MPTGLSTNKTMAQVAMALLLPSTISWRLGLTMPATKKWAISAWGTRIKCWLRLVWTIVRHKFQPLHTACLVIPNTSVLWVCMPVSETQVKTTIPTKLLTVRLKILSPTFSTTATLKRTVARFSSASPTVCLSNSLQPLSPATWVSTLANMWFILWQIPRLLKKLVVWTSCHWLVVCATISLAWVV